MSNREDPFDHEGFKELIKEAKADMAELGVDLNVKKTAAKVVGIGALIGLFNVTLLLGFVAAVCFVVKWSFGL